jgi:hypothetical protein
VVGSVGSGRERNPRRARAGPGLLLAEACEYNRSFHHHRPTVASIANVEADHLDIYGSLDAVVEAFAGSHACVPPASEGGRLLIGHDNAHRREITAGLACAGRDDRVQPVGRLAASRYDPATRRTSVAGPGRHRVVRALDAGRAQRRERRARAALAVTLGAEPETVGAVAVRVRGARPAHALLAASRPGRDGRRGTFACTTTTGTTRPRSMRRSARCANTNAPRRTAGG